MSVSFSRSPFEPSLDSPPEPRLLLLVSRRDTSDVHSIRGRSHGGVVEGARSTYSENESELSPKSESRSLETLETPACRQGIGFQKIGMRFGRAVLGGESEEMSIVTT